MPGITELFLEAIAVKLQTTLIQVKGALGREIKKGLAKIFEENMEALGIISAANLLAQEITPSN